MTYLLFMGDDYYPRGGWNDFVGEFPTHEAAQAEVKARAPDDEWAWWHIVNATTRCIVERSEDKDD